MCSFLIKDMIRDNCKIMVDNEISVLNKMLNDEVRDYYGENWGILYHLDYYHPDSVLYHTTDVSKMKSKVLKVLSAYYRHEYSFYMPNIILFKVTNINPQLVTLDLLDRTQSQYYYIIRNCKFNVSINTEVPFLMGVFTRIIDLMVEYAFIFESNVQRRRLVAFYKQKTGVKTVKWHKTASSMRIELAKCKFNEIRGELERINV